MLNPAAIVGEMFDWLDRSSDANRYEKYVSEKNLIEDSGDDSDKSNCEAASKLGPS
jgi:hypothetical protein